MKRYRLVLVLGTLVLGSLMAQTTQDPAIAAAKAKLEVVYDLGRVFSYIYTMDTKEKTLALTASQVKALLGYAEAIRSDQRIEPEEAEAMLDKIENTVLNAKQLMYIDQLAIERMNTKTTTAGTNAGSSTGTSPVQSYINGGPFNPMLDTTKTIGKDFQTAYNYLKGKK